MKRAPSIRVHVLAYADGALYPVGAGNGMAAYARASDAHYVRRCVERGEKAKLRVLRIDVPERFLSSLGFVVVAMRAP